MVNNIKEKILDAALEQFLLHGKTGATTKGIADTAGVNKALIHYYFSSKDLLFLSCVERILTQMEETFHSTNLKSIQDYENYLNALISSYTQFIQKHDRQIIFLIWEYLNDKTLLNEIKNVLGSSHLVYFINMTDIAIKEHVIERVDPLNLYINVISLVLSTHLLLPITLSFLGDDAVAQKDLLIEKRRREISRLIWKDIKKGE